MDSASYWESYHRAVCGVEWYADAATAHAHLGAVRRLLGDAAPKTAALHVGCGSCTLGDLLEAEPAVTAHTAAAAAAASAAPACARVRVLHTDFAPACLEAQRARRPAAAASFAELDVRADPRALLRERLGTPTVDLIVDKGTFDALLQRGGDAVRDDARDGVAALVIALRAYAAAPQGTSQGKGRLAVNADDDTASSGAARVRSVLAIISIVPPERRLPMLTDALSSRLDLLLSPIAPPPGAADAAARGELVVRASLATADRRVSLHAVEIPLAPLEMPGQAASYVYYLAVESAAVT